MNSKSVVILIIFLILFKKDYGQTDTLKISFQQGESTFLQNNLSLIAQRYHIEATRALVLQAKLWDNPNLA